MRSLFLEECCQYLNELNEVNDTAYEYSEMSLRLRLADAYRSGERVTVNKQKAYAIYKHCFKQGCGSALFYLASIHYLWCHTQRLYRFWID